MDRLELLTAAALAGLASRERARHGHEQRSAEDIGREAVELARATAAALEDVETAPKIAPAKRR